MAHAQDALRRLQLGTALKLAQEGLNSGHCRPEETAGFHAVLGSVWAIQGFDDAAADSFARVLELSRTFELPPTASPKLLGPYQAARARVGPHGLSATDQTRKVGKEEARTTVVVENDTQGVVVSAQLFPHSPAGAQSIVLARAQGFSGDWLCPDARCPHHVVLYDGRGNQLMWLGTEEAPLLAQRTSSEVNWFSRPRGYLVLVAGLLAGATTYFGLEYASSRQAVSSAVDHKTASTYAQTLALQSTENRNYALMLGSAVGLGLCGGALVLTW